MFAKSYGAVTFGVDGRIIEFAQLEKLDFTGKRVAPFCTHEGSGLGKSEKDVRAVCARAEVVKGLAVKGTEAAASA